MLLRGVANAVAFDVGRDRLRGRGHVVRRLVTKSSSLLVTPEPEEDFLTRLAAVLRVAEAERKKTLNPLRVHLEEAYDDRWLGPLARRWRCEFCGLFGDEIECLGGFLHAVGSDGGVVRVSFTQMRRRRGWDGGTKPCRNPPATRPTPP